MHDVAKDLQNNGTWIGLECTTKRVAFVTNFREADVYPNGTFKSRGVSTLNNPRNEKDNLKI